jgi:hypothetical protein
MKVGRNFGDFNLYLSIGNYLKAHLIVALIFYLYMVKQFILQCLFFQSEEKIHKLFGALTWLSILLFLYAVVNLWRTWQ